MADKEPLADEVSRAEGAAHEKKKWGWGEWLGVAGLIATLVTAAIFFFGAPTWRELVAFPNTWVDKETHSHLITIHKSDTQVQEEGDLPFLLEGTPYTSKFLCQLQRAGNSWRGKCNYDFFILATGFHCQTQTNELITEVSRRRIVGSSQELVPPAKANQCPAPKGGPDGQPLMDFELVPKD